MARRKIGFDEVLGRPSFMRASDPSGVKGKAGKRAWAFIIGALPDD